ncbi:MAG: cytochrome C biogenesis protein CcsA [Campylobacter sp.]|nr:cytochrome C biogenesis protein CcsA [Campylobacter sp.]
MKKFLFSLCCLFALQMSVFANQTMDEKIKSRVIRYGMVPIPKDANLLDNLIMKEYSKNSSWETTPQRIELGKKLFFDKRLSRDGDISCATCHDLNDYGVEKRRVSMGSSRKLNPFELNSPTIYNSVFNSVQFWDGRLSTLSDQVVGPLLNDYEMANTKENVVKTINSIPGYITLFNEAFDGEKITFELIANAFEIYERTLILRSRYDDYLEGDLNALSDEEKEGFLTFFDGGCASCHNGINFGGTMRQFEIFGNYKYRDIGGFRGDISGLIKAPSLRLVTKTAPYFHNGMIETLDEAIATMMEVQTGYIIDDRYLQPLKKFLEVLAPEIQYVDEPELP